MKIAIVVHSHSGNTLSVAEKLKDALAAKGHTAAVERVSAVNEDPQARGPVALAQSPVVSGFDAVIFAAPVWAFSLSTVMQAYLQQLPAMQGKRAGVFVTQHLPFAWLGGNRAVRQLKRACESAGAAFFDSGVINWSSKKREEKTAAVVGRLSLI